ncbi:MAG: hypothetical protein RR482_03490, partial [Clostridia bacterium]
AACVQQGKAMESFFEEQSTLYRQVVQMRAMEAPLKWIRGRTRWQLFLKLYARGPTAPIFDRLSVLAEEVWEGVTVCLEIDPTNMI